MYRYTTPTLPLTITDVDFTDVNYFRVAIEQGKTEMLKVVNVNDPNVDAENKTIYIPLTQEETAALLSGPAEVQVRIKFTNNAVLATNKANITVKDVLDEVII